MTERYPVQYSPIDPIAAPFPAPPAPSDSCQQLMRLATIGAVVGGSAAAASSVRRVQAGVVEPGAAILETGKRAVTAGVVTALAGAVAGAVNEQGVVRLGLMFAVGAAAMYGVERWRHNEFAD